MLSDKICSGKQKPDIHIFRNNSHNQKVLGIKNHLGRERERKRKTILGKWAFRLGKEADIIFW